MNSRISTLILIKNLIENNHFSKVYSLKGEFFWTNKEIYKHLCYFNFGSALLEIENELFTILNDEDFEEAIHIEEDEDDNVEHYISDDHNDSYEDSTDWSHYNDDLDMDQQSEEFWNQF